MSRIRYDDYSGCQEWIEDTPENRRVVIEGVVDVMQTTTSGKVIISQSDSTGWENQVRLWNRIWNEAEGDDEERYIDRERLIAYLINDPDAWEEETE